MAQRTLVLGAKDCYPRRRQRATRLVAAYDRGVTRICRACNSASSSSSRSCGSNRREPSFSIPLLPEDPRHATIVRRYQPGGPLAPTWITVLGPEDQGPLGQGYVALPSWPEMGEAVDCSTKNVDAGPKDPARARRHPKCAGGHLTRSRRWRAWCSRSCWRSAAGCCCGGTRWSAPTCTTS